jgi:rhodanese-related sulfurtransferase
MKNKFKTPDPKKAKRYFARKLAFSAGPVELGRWLKERKDIKIVDVRDADTYAKGHIPGAVNLPQEKWHKTAALDKNKTSIVYCYSQTCHLAARAALEFAGQGFPVMELDGGFNVWKEKGLPVEKRSARKVSATRKARKHGAKESEAAELPQTETLAVEQTPETVASSSDAQ